MVLVEPQESPSRPWQSAGVRGDMESRAELPEPVTGLLGPEAARSAPARNPALLRGASASARSARGMGRTGAGLVWRLIPPHLSCPALVGGCVLLIPRDTSPNSTMAGARTHCACALRAARCSRGYSSLPA